MSVLATPKVLEYIERLVPTLYENGYFSYEEDARKYVKDLYDDIKTLCLLVYIDLRQNILINTERT